MRRTNKQTAEEDSRAAEIQTEQTKIFEMPQTGQPSQHLELRHLPQHEHVFRRGRQQRYIQRYSDNQHVDSRRNDSRGRVQYYLGLGQTRG